MDKPADSPHPLHELLRMRWSPRAFSPREVSDEQLRTLLDAARWAPSCFNAQPWRFVVGHKGRGEDFQRLLECLLPGNQTWAGSAQVLLLSVAREAFDNGGANRHAWHDVGLATAQLILQAEALGLRAHAMAGFDVEKARAALQIPGGFSPVSALALGYLGDAAQLPPALQERERAPRVRLSQPEMAFRGRWNAPL